MKDATFNFSLGIVMGGTTMAVVFLTALSVPRENERIECAQKNNVFECVHVAVPKATADAMAAMEAMAGLMGVMK